MVKDFKILKEWNLYFFLSKKYYVSVQFDIQFPFGIGSLYIKKNTRTWSDNLYNILYE